jgi:hypothetical protein
MEKWQAALCKRAETGRPASDWPSHLGWWPISAMQGWALGHGGAGGGPAGFRWCPVTRCSGEGPGSKVVGWWTHFRAAGRKSSPEEHVLWRGVVGRRGTAVGAASGGGGRQLTVRGGCTQWRGARGVVELVGERLEWAVHGGSATAGMVA